MSMTTEQLAALLATPTAFREWLQSKEPGEVVGERRSCSACPLAAFAVAHGADTADVGRQHIHVEESPIDGGITLRLPRWANTVIGRVDHPTDEFADRLIITAAECLAILDEIGGEG